MRVLMVLANMGDTDRPAVWAQRQIESLNRLGVDTDTYLFRNRRSILGLLQGGLAVRRLARKFHADLVHIHFGAAQCLVGTMMAGLPVVISFCGSDILGNYDSHGKKTWSGWLSGVLSRIGALGCRRAIAKTQELKDSLWFPWVRKKCHVIPNGVDLEVFRPMPQGQARAALGWDHDDPVVLFMDRKGAWVKDPGLASAALDHVRQSIPTARLHTVEHEPAESMPLFFNAADALLITSRHEGSNNTVKEALASNLPVVATHCGDTQERLRSVELCHVCPRDAQALGARLVEVLSARERSNGRRFLHDLTIDRVAQRVVAVYEEALGRRPVRDSLQFRCE